MSAASNFHIRLSRVRTKGDERPRNFHICYARVRIMRGRRPDGWSRIGNFLNRWARVRTNADWRPNGGIWIVILALFMSTFGRDNTSSGRCINLPLFWIWKESEADWSLMDVRTGCWDVRTDASWNISISIQWRVRTEKYVVRTDKAVDRLTSGRDDASSGWLTGNLKSFIFFAVQSLLKMLWKVESLFTTSLHISDFVQTEWGQNTNKLPLLSFWDKNHLAGLEIHSRSKIKITPHFCHKGTKGKPE
jgi:hypothetical protein